ncbi:hypothetical protein Bca101_067586 [Brassica carinata]
MAVKTDMSKAYDRLEWEFIQGVMERMDFHSTWISRVMLCLSTVSYAYLVNDAAHRSVCPSRGIRQEDPLSPYLFILCSEVLSVLCRKAQQAGLLAGVRVARRAPRINHLLFADDTMFFLHSDELSCSTLVSVLQRYEMASGQTINANKSSVTFSSKTIQEIRTRVKSILGIVKEGGVGKYIGLPEHFGRRKRDLFTSIVDRIRQQANSWSTRQLSSAGKLTMLKSVFSASPTYSMTYFLLPVSLYTFLVGWDLIVTKLGKVIGDGNTTKVWTQALIKADSFCAPYGPPGEDAQDLYVSDLLLRGTIEWNAPKVRSLLPQQAKDILCMRPSKLGAGDSFVWTGTTSGEYSAKSGYFAAMARQQQERETQVQTRTFDWEKNIWILKTAPKIQIFLWKIVQDALPLGAALQRRGVLATSVTCSRCGNVETADHLFLHCRFTRRVWNLLPTLTTLDVSAEISFEQALEMAKSLTNLPPAGVSLNLFPWFVWTIWTARNALVFENLDLSPQDIASKATRLARDWQNAQPPTSTHLSSKTSRQHNPRTVNTIDVFTDAAWRTSDKSAGCGWHFRDPNTGYSDRELSRKHQ